MEKQQEPVRILRMPAVEQQYGKKRSSIYVDVDRELFPKPVEIGPGCRGWPESEVQAIIFARIQGKTEDEIKRLVGQLHARRKTIGDNAPELAK
jgi:prophage regulatory protein